MAEAVRGAAERFQMVVTQAILNCCVEVGQGEVEDALTTRFFPAKTREKLRNPSTSSCQAGCVSKGDRVVILTTLT